MQEGFEKTEALCEESSIRVTQLCPGDAALCDEASLSPTLSYGERNVLRAFCGSLSQWLTFKL